jgi:hypothetical protein
LLALALIALPASAEIQVQGSQAKLRWAPALGPVAGYHVFSSRNQGPLRYEKSVSTPEVSLSGTPGELLVVSVAAYATNTTGPLSASSEPIRFASSFSLLGIGVFDCSTCKRIELRQLGRLNTLVALAHPPGGTWDLQRFAPFVAGPSAQALMRERSSGALWIGEVVNGALAPLASNVASYFPTSFVGAITDLTSDGASEIALRDLVTGRVEFWGLIDGVLKRRKTLTTPVAWRLFGAHDLDADGRAELWFVDTSDGSLEAMKIQTLESAGITSIAVNRPGWLATDVADYDGDGMPDVLWRDATGRLAFSLLRGNRAAPTVEMRELPYEADDRTLQPRFSLELDGKPGVEVLLQDTDTGLFEVLLPSEGGRKQPVYATGSTWRLVQASK